MLRSWDMLGRLTDEVLWPVTHDEWPNRKDAGASIPPASDGESSRMPGGSTAWTVVNYICRGDRWMPGASRESSLGCRGHLVMPGASTKPLHKKTASLRVGWIVSDTREEKSVTTVRFDWEISRPLLPARFREEETARRWNRRWEVSADRRWTRRTANTKRTSRPLDCCIARDLKSDCICLPIFTVSYLYQKFSGKINLAYIIVVLGHGLKRTSVKLDLVRTITDSVFISYDYCTPLILC